MFRKFEVVYVYNQLDIKNLLHPTIMQGMAPIEVSELLDDVEMLNRSLSKPKKSERWVVKFEVTTLWFFKKTHKLYLRSRSENGAVAKAKKFALGEK